MSRLQRTFQIDAALTTKRDQKWIDEALASGPATPLTKRETEAIRDRILRGKTGYFCHPLQKNRK